LNYSLLTVELVTHCSEARPKMRARLFLGKDLRLMKTWALLCVGIGLTRNSLRHGQTLENGGRTRKERLALIVDWG